jgi:carboxyl-terminal processing protease
VTSFRVRSVLVLVIGTVLGLTVSVGAALLSERPLSGPQLRSDAGADDSLRLLTEVIQRVRSEYVDPVDERRLVESAIRGLIAELDPHSRYLDRDEFENIRINTSGNYSGVGLDVRVEDGRVRVVTPLDDTPAARAGILPGDVLVSIDDVAIDAASLERTVSLMRGRPGTFVTLGVEREGAVEPLRFALVRAQIQLRTVQSEMLPEDYAYVRLTAFTDQTAGDLRGVLRRMTGDGPPRGLILDLRNNPGGVLEAAIAVADLFLDQGVIVTGAGRFDDVRFEHRATGNDLMAGVPITVLINRGSASASEIVAGALQDHGRARLVGERSYGKASIQTVTPLASGGAVKLTTSRYLTPLGHDINETGIEPDVTVRNSDPRRQFRGSSGDVTFEQDLQLQEALSLLGYNAFARAR